MPPAKKSAKKAAPKKATKTIKKKAPAKKKPAAKGKKPAKKSAKKDAKDKKPRKPSPYMNFCKKERAGIVKANPKATFGEVGKLLGKKWGSLSDGAKAKFA